ncbi:MAG: YbjN domain-containing protein [Candidatus Methanomethylicaceae archaeon]
MEQGRPLGKQLIEEYLRNVGFEKSMGFDLGERGLIFSGWKSEENPEGDHLVIEFRREPRESSHLSIQILQIFSAPKLTTPSKHLCELWQALCYLNYRLPFGKFGYDPSDGEVRFTVQVPVNPDNYTEEEFKMVIATAVGAVDRYKQRLIDIRDGKQTFEHLYEWDRESREKKEEPEESPERLGAMMAQLLRQLADRIEEAVREQAEKSEQDEESTSPSEESATQEAD